MHPINLMIVKTIVTLTVITIGYQMILDPTVNIVNDVVKGATDFISALPMK